jgi:hypothetical protein
MVTVPQLGRELFAEEPLFATLSKERQKEITAAFIVSRTSEGKDTPENVRVIRNAALMAAGPEAMAQCEVVRASPEEYGEEPERPVRAKPPGAGEVEAARRGDVVAEFAKLMGSMTDPELGVALGVHRTTAGFYRRGVVQEDLTRPQVRSMAADVKARIAALEELLTKLV